MNLLRFYCCCFYRPCVLLLLYSHKAVFILFVKVPWPKHKICLFSRVVYMIHNISLQCFTSVKPLIKLTIKKNKTKTKTNSFLKALYIVR